MAAAAAALEPYVPPAVVSHLAPAWVHRRVWWVQIRIRLRAVRGYICEGRGQQPSELGMKILFSVFWNLRRSCRAVMHVLVSTRPASAQRGWYAASGASTQRPQRTLRDSRKTMVKRIRKCGFLIKKGWFKFQSGGSPFPLHLATVQDQHAFEQGALAEVWRGGRQRQSSGEPAVGWRPLPGTNACRSISRIKFAQEGLPERSAWRRGLGDSAFLPLPIPGPCAC